MEFKKGKTGLGKECEKVLRSVPKWFGREEELVKYVEDIDKLPTYSAFDNGRIAAFFTIKKHFEKSCELYVLAVDKKYHGMGIGTRLYNLVEEEMKKKGMEFIQVKTLSPKVKNKEYLKTMEFYEKMGFIPLEDTEAFWGKSAPCLQMIKRI